MQEQIREQSDWFLAQRRARGSSGSQRGRVTQGAADLGKHATATSVGRRLGGGLRRRKKTHERGELGDVAERLGHGRCPEVRLIFGSPVEQTRRSLVAFRLDQFVHDPNLYVVSFVCK